MNYKLDTYEQEILDHVKHGDFKPLPKVEKERLLAKMKMAAQNNISERKSVTLRLNIHDLERLRVRAKKEGMPYQTYIGSVLHKAVAV